MLSPDYIPPEVAFPLAIVLALIFFALEAHAKQQSQEVYVEAYVTHDCRGSRHDLCMSCGCHCHVAPNPENRSQ